MINQQLIDFIKSETSKGVPKEVIISKLTSEGWTAEDANEAFTAILNPYAFPNLSPEATTPAKKEFLSDQAYFFIGLLGFCFFPAIIIFLLRKSPLGLFVFAGVAVIVFLVVLLNTWVFNKWTKRMKTHAPSWRKAFFMFGILPIISVAFSFLSFLPILNILPGILVIILWVLIAKKVYLVSFWKGFVLWFLMVFGLALPLAIVGIILSIFLAGWNNLRTQPINELESTIQLSTEEEKVESPEVAQNNTPENSLRNPMVNFNDWKKFSDSTRGFSLTFPEDPTISVLSSKEDTLLVETIETQVGKFKYSMDYIVFPESYYKGIDSAIDREKKSIALHLSLLTLFYGSDLKYAELEPVEGHQTWSFSIDTPEVSFFGKITGISGKAYAYSTECTGSDCSNVPFQKEFLESFTLIK